MRALLALLGTTGCAARITPADLVCLRASPVVVDGLGNDAVWSHARLTPLRPVDPSRESQPSSAMCAWDDTGMTMFVDVRDTDLYATVTEHDGITWYDDVIEWFIEPTPGGPYIEVHVTPRGTMLDLRLPAPDGVDARTSHEPVFHVRSAVSLRGDLAAGAPDEGWSAELFVPWTDLPGTAPRRGDVWRGHVARYDHVHDGEPTLYSTATFTELSFHRRIDWTRIHFRR